MSPTAFKQQVAQLVSEITRCFELCDAIRTNRRLGSTHEALDQLQLGLKDSAHEIQIEYGTLRNVIGSRMELGDETARTTLTKAIRDVQSSIQPRLNDIAYRRRDSRDPEVPGFRELSRKLAKVEGGVLEALESLGRRLGEPKPEIPKPTTTPKQPQKPKLKLDEAVISLKELEALMGHMKNSWVETAVAGKILYVNVFDDKKSQWDRPKGFIKALPHAPKPATRHPTWEQSPRPARDDFWNNPNGW
jgi:hypothetical protein